MEHLVRTSLIGKDSNSFPDDCAIKCQQFILEQFTGRFVAEATLVREAMERGWYVPGGGTPLADVGKLLELHDVGVTQYQHASQFHLAMELAQGHKVIVGVESDALWHSNPLLPAVRDMLGVQGVADHAVVVSGIDTSDPQHVLVQVSDPGTGQPLASYPMEQFLDAWRGSDFFMAATQDPAPSHLLEMSHFDYTVGHIADIAGQPYEQFLEYADHPGEYADVVHHYVERDADGQQSLRASTYLGCHGEHGGEPGAVIVHHDSVTDTQDHDASHGGADTTHCLGNGETAHDWS